MSNADRLLDLLRHNPSATYVESSRQLGVSVSTVRRAMARLVDEGRVTRVGADKNGHWEVLG